MKTLVSITAWGVEFKGKEGGNLSLLLRMPTQDFSSKAQMTIRVEESGTTEHLTTVKLPEKSLVRANV
jgi:hypothetical protein